MSEKISEAIKMKGTRITYVRIGDDSVPANAADLKQLVLHGNGFKKIKVDYRRAVNYRKELVPVFTSTPTSFFTILYNLNYNVPVGFRNMITKYDIKKQRSYVPMRELVNAAYQGSIPKW